MKKTSFLIAGKHAVTEALKNPKRNVLRVFLTEDSKKNLNKENQNLNLLKNVKIFYKTKTELDRLCSKDQITHQGLIAEIEHLENFTIKDFLIENSERDNINFVALEEVTDPRNIGSIIRSASSFDIDGIIVVKRSYPVEPLVIVSRDRPLVPRAGVIDKPRIRDHHCPCLTNFPKRFRR